ncbi:hypothetical protein J2Y74_001067 [Pseudomonas migulae]|uniref:hypothetical protein n=1 Tax=Pseudomonas migulae TaxID=78543 RepID=UPI0020A0BD41|nr:hypothetical protein [Pseudomonas migulae]MCP1516757.1 hypothetical protein [Pseudomonas migulae]
MEPQVIGSTFKSVRGLGAIFTPAQNTAGMIIRTATLHSGKGYAILSTGTVAPTIYTDLSVPVVLAVRGDAESSGSFGGAGETLPFPLIIPAGQGLWFAGANGSMDSAYVSYDPVK